MADVMEIADDRHMDAPLRQPFPDMRHGRRRLVTIDGDAHDLGTRARQSRDLRRGAVHIGGIGVGHRLDDDGRAAADEHAADIDRHGHVPGGWARGYRDWQAGKGVEVGGHVGVSIVMLKLVRQLDDRVKTQPSFAAMRA